MALLATRLATLAAWITELEPLWTQPQVRRPPPPAEPGASMLQPLILVLLVFSVAVWVRYRRRKKAGKPVGIRGWAFGAAVGNALLDLNALFQPERPAATSVQNIEEEGVVDEQGDGRKPRSKPVTAAPPDDARS